MNDRAYYILSADQIEKIGNAAIYLSSRIRDLSKTKFLKMLYILDEVSIQKTGIPFFNLQYKVWKLGPVSEEIYVDITGSFKFLSKYIVREATDVNQVYLKAKGEFDDSEFSELDMDTMDLVISEFGRMTAKELIDYTHRTNSLWSLTARENSVLDLLNNEEINNTEHIIDLGRLVAHDPQKMELYLDYIESH